MVSRATILLALLKRFISTDLELVKQVILRYGLVYIIFQ